MTKKKFDFKTPGSEYHDFVVTKAIEITELQCTLHELTHIPTGAQIMHIGNDDPENLFCLSFQTLPENSNGVAHILEHTVLCGSKKFPVKDPFFSMNRRSLNTFMNALTGADFTCYPAATQEPKDFYNLLDVYLDAVFKPNLKEYSFLQEGHRLEFAVPSDPNSPLEYKGIVYNEMKGALASATSRIGEAMNEALFPDICYGHNSGGEPKVIPSLTYQELIDFHAKYYHPSRCLFFFYGNMPLEDHLDFIAKNALKGVKELPPLPSLPLQPRFKKPKQLELTYPISSDDETEDQGLLSLGWLTCSVLDQEEILALSILEIILMDTDASPLKRAIMNSGYCKQAASYFDSDYSEVPFILLLRGVTPHSADKLEKVIRESLATIIKEGIPPEFVEKALHRMEIFRSEISGDHAPFGLTLFMRSGLLKQHGAVAESGLMIHTLFDDLKASIAHDSRYLENLLQKHLLDNPHCVRIVMTPDKELAAKELADETTTLAKIREQLTEKDVKDILHTTKKLSDFQKEQEDNDLDILPKVTLEDVNPIARVFPLEIENRGPLQIFHHTCFTNEILYADLVFNLPAVAEEDLSIVRLFTILLTQVGCGGRDYLETLDNVQANTGGIGASLTLNIQAQDCNRFYPSLHIRGKALHRKAEQLMLLLRDYASSPDFTDAHRLKEVISKHFTGLHSSLNQGGLKYAVNLSGSRINVPGKIVNDWYGLNYYYKVQELATNWEKHSKAFIEKMQYLQNHLLCLDNPHLIISSDKPMYEELVRHKFYGLQDIKTKPAEPWNGDYSLPSIVPQGRIIASPVAFTGKVFQTVSYIHPDAAALNIASFLFDNICLHASIREQGGAYGGGAVANTVSGVFYFYAYRDPNIVTSLEAFEEAVKVIERGDFDEEDLEEAKLEMVQALDTPVSPGNRADLAYGWMREGKTPELRQKFREKVLSLTREDVIKAVKKHISSKLDTGAIVTFASKDLLEKENATLIRMGKTPLHIAPV